MLNFEHEGHQLCDGVTRREWLSVGTLSAVGFSLPQLFAGRAAAAETGSTLRATAKACIQIFLWGGPCAQETFDLKPDAPEQVRGLATPAATSVPGIQFTEHLPGLAARADRLCIVRSLAHTGTNHGTSSYHMLTGHIHSSPGTLRHPTKHDMPNIGCNAARFLTAPAGLPLHVHAPSIVKDGDELPVPGQDPGILGDRHAPFRVLGDLTRPDFQIPELTLGEGVNPTRLRERAGLRRLLSTQAEQLARSGAGSSLDQYYTNALELLQSSRTEAAFRLAAEPEKVRERYGRHYFGQSLLLARRLVEAGVPFVTVYWNPYGETSKVDFEENWDTHKDEHRKLKEKLLPPFDHGLSALLDDLCDRGLFDETLVTWYGEFGRTPKVDKSAGRGHWGFCQSIGLAGGGIQRGVVHGASTDDGGYPARDAVSPDDLAATIFHCLGIDHKQHMHDLQGRPIPLSYGEPVYAVL